MVTRPTYTRAIPAAAGYPQYSGNLIPPIYSQTIIENLYAMTIYSEISTSEYLGELRGRGDQITFFQEPCVIVRDSIKDGTIKHDTFESNTMTLVIDRAKEFSYKLADLDAEFMQIWPKMRALILRKTARAIQEAIDCELLAEMYTHVHCDNQGPRAGCDSHAFNLGQIGNPVSVNATNVLEVITNMAAVLSEQNVPDDEGRFLVVPTVMAHAIMNSELRMANISGLGRSLYLNGKLPHDIAGFTIYQSNRIRRVIDPITNTLAWHIIGGHRSATSFASVVNRTRTMEDKDSWDKYYQGQSAYGFGVVRPEALVHLYARFN